MGLNFYVVQSGGGARRFLNHFNLGVLRLRYIEVFSTAFTYSGNMIATTTDVFKRKKITLSSRIQETSSIKILVSFGRTTTAGLEPTMRALLPAIVRTFSVRLCNV
jgi:hypothetical protein